MSIDHSSTPSMNAAPLRVVVSNLFGDVNRGGAAITAETLRVLLSLDAEVTGISVHTDHPALSHPHTSRRFPNVALHTSGGGGGVSPPPMRSMRSR